MEQVSATRCHGGVQGAYTHASAETGTPMAFSVFVPDVEPGISLPVLWFLSGLTCTPANVTEKGEYRAACAKAGIVFIAPDTSPRGADVPDDAGWDFGQGAGFYVDATEAPWATNFRMRSYVEQELPALVAKNFPVDLERQGITGHSMGGHGALTSALRNPDRFRSVSAFSPIVSPLNCPWGEKALTGYLGADQAARRVLLTGHMDTVFAADDPFQQCDWLDAETLHGPGTADMKGGLALMLAGLIAFERSGPTLGYDVLVNSDEETGSLSSAPLIRQLAAGKLAALTYEPALAPGVLAGARPGSGNFSAVMRGRSAHAGRNPRDGRNALLAAADLALRLAAAQGPELTVNPARIDGGGPNNRVPDLAVLRFNIRPLTPAAAGLAQASIAAMVAQVAAAHEVSIDLHGGFSRPPKPVDAAAERLFALVTQAAADLGQSCTRADTGGVCDGNNIAACGVPVVDTMGAVGGAIHSPDEFLKPASLPERARLTALTLHRLDRQGLAA